MFVIDHIGSVKIRFILSLGEWVASSTKQHTTYRTEQTIIWLQTRKRIYLRFCFLLCCCGSFLLERPHTRIIWLPNLCLSYCNDKYWSMFVCVYHPNQRDMCRKQYTSAPATHHRQKHPAWCRQIWEIQKLVVFSKFVYWFILTAAITTENKLWR